MIADRLEKLADQLEAQMIELRVLSARMSATLSTFEPITVNQLLPTYGVSAPQQIDQVAEELKQMVARTRKLVEARRAAREAEPTGNGSWKWDDVIGMWKSIPTPPPVNE